jgi:hypothetical protein
MEALAFPVHCTQGPPGTGKSYVGVYVTLALLIVRKLWMKANPSVGAPPILVLSYKNHAIDEFLLDIVAAKPGVRILRTGNTDENILQRYTTKGNSSRNSEVIAKRTLVQNTYNFLKLLRGLPEKRSLLFLAKPLENSEKSKFQRKVEYDATIVLHQLFGRVSRVFELLKHCSIEFDFSTDCTAFDQDLIDAISKLYRDKSLPSISYAGLMEGMKKRNFKDEELLWHWMTGRKPKPSCVTEECDNDCDFGQKYCDDCRCSFCEKQHLLNRKLCEDHYCSFPGCDMARIPIGSQQFCTSHSCFICLQISTETPAGVTEDYIPRNVCVNHELCCATVNMTSGEMCLNLAMESTSYCEVHNIKVCKGITKRGNSCKSRRLISQSIPFCQDHRDQYVPIPEAPKDQSLHCHVANCKSNALKGLQYCSIHLNNRFKPFQNAAESENIEIAQLFDANLDDMSADESISAFSIIETAPNSTQEKLLSDSESDFHPVDVRVSLEDLEEMELGESDYLIHVKEVYEVPAAEEKDDLLEEDVDFVPNQQVPPINARFTPLDKFKWTMSMDEVWQVIDEFCQLDDIIIRALDSKVVDSLLEAREQFKYAMLQAESQIYEDKEIIAGTIVGCITRLEAIRATNPFAIVIEEASEVLEPLLFSVLGSSSLKLELIGDHLQLKPSMLSKYDFEKINKMNTSMFERLICAPESHHIPSSVLSVQRRMRTNICDLTRSFYVGITDIVDHENCNARKIKSSALLKASQSGGLLIPSIVPQMYFWSHQGQQSKASVGVSKVNSTEVKMICSLAEFLVTSGVPKSSLAILTPYRGQLMQIRKSLPRGFLNHPDRANSCIVSTVDRFQGDEADIVLVSLVTDSKSRTPFVTLVNRMIVLLSRARVGMYIVGNLGYFENKSVEHWQDIFRKLSSPATNPVGIFPYDGASIGPNLMICCPLHRNESKREICKPEDLKLGFCDILCKEALPCSHDCSLPCHFPKLSHNTKCNVMFDSPCSAHAIKIPCHQFLIGKASIDIAYQSFKCNAEVSIQLPCAHEIRVKCWQEEEIANGVRAFPECHNQSPVPYLHQTCNHTVQCTCSELVTFTAYPSRMKNCSVLVDYIPGCGHLCQVKCYAARLYKVNEAIHVCSLLVEVMLPHCSHQAKMSCREAIALKLWNGSPAVNGTVSEGKSYGPISRTCKEKIQYSYLCGHVANVTCDLAFGQMPACDISMEVTDPICGHVTQHPCYAAQKLRTIPRKLDPVTLVKEGQSSDELFLQSPLGMAHRCKFTVSYQRLCGHITTTTCAASRKLLDRKSICAVKVQDASPLCGHTIETSCSSLRDWHPWKPEFIGTDAWLKITSDHILCGQEIPHYPDIDNAFNCEMPMELTLDCSHLVTLKCSAAFNALIQMRKPRCQQIVDLAQKCGHRILVECYKAEKILQNPICEKIISLKCWNYFMCGKTVEMMCKKGDGAPISCGSLIKWKCASGQHEFDLKVCSTGIPKMCPYVKK